MTSTPLLHRRVGALRGSVPRLGRRRRARRRLAEAERQGAEPLLVTTQQDTQRDGPEAIVSFARRYTATTPGGERGEGGVRGGRRRAPGPVLAFLPDYRAMELALLYARGSSLAVVEFPADPLTGWAIETGALNLLTGQPTPDHRTERQREALDRIHTYGGAAAPRAPSGPCRTCSAPAPWTRTSSWGASSPAATAGRASAAWPRSSRRHPRRRSPDRPAGAHSRPGIGDPAGGPMNLTWPSAAPHSCADLVWSGRE
ncbi:hypothetical protein ACLQ2P_41410 [Actinomadura citrea]|uniref:hypothetical protein n=1 Tax=Actinomadura citrea TaxID=46158 RepID=UPI003CE5AFFF